MLTVLRGRQYPITVRATANFAKSPSVVILVLVQKGAQRNANETKSTFI